MKKKIYIMIALMLIAMGLVSAARLPTIRGDTGTWGTTLNEYLNVSHDMNGTIRNGTITAVMLDLADITVSSFDNDAGYLTSLPDSYASTSNVLYLQPNKDSSARVRFFSNTTGSPLISQYGYNPIADARPWMYAGMFDYTSVDGYMRYVIGASGGYDDVAAKLEIQSPYQVRITGVDSIIDTANVRIAASTDIEIHPRTLAETDSASYLVIDTVGNVRGADVELSVSSGNLMIKGGFTGECINISYVGGIAISCND